MLFDVVKYVQKAPQILNVCSYIIHNPDPCQVRYSSLCCIGKVLLLIAVLGELGSSV